MLCISYDLNNVALIACHTTMFYWLSSRSATIFKTPLNKIAAGADISRGAQTREATVCAASDASACLSSWTTCAIVALLAVASTSSEGDTSMLAT
mmetsp:Transcript_23905/g.43222  ORF Transcript_23905/g.43222 Transcript_23905/m.43222 type:complete len:95 (+) Transcript_23905:4-288(+)